ncbi:hypothetical protein [Mangrovihabitans endophyticus]|uniref:Uncharacterized protein n=1 Tax=Mangrovihabitans endophyticus TaxID=1751298 RepID=A0A8J3C215_9ACTN|nr:hypothetical protein [Mangrovihabitans endophyticus]GGL06442.1 hypothetical protein GCM10012284_45910 [Mangrovihabitans endophyticus]
MRHHTPPGSRTEPPPADDAAAWITGAVTEGWFTEPPEVVIDRDEIIVWGRLPQPELAAEATEADRAAAQSGRINQFREDTRNDRIRVARQVEHRYQRKVAWGLRCGDTAELFTHLAAPVMTRLRQPERQVLDTLVEAGVARSRSEALAWCVKLVGQHSEDWLAELRSAMAHVDEVRRQGPA